jgi:CubicO group peptidase (beta-lactamase class C family)
MSVDLGNLARETAGRLAADHVWVVVAAVVRSSVEISSAGTVGRTDQGTPDATTLFEIGSVTKVFTALALAKQSLAGLVDLDEPVRQLLPAGVQVPSRAGREITLRHLATHTSGLPRLPKGMLWRVLLHPNEPDPYAQCSAELIFEGLSRTKLHAPPGDRFRYSNLGGGLLGLALASRAGTTYESVIDAEVCRPLGLTDTHISLDPARAERLAQGHTRKRKVTPLWNLNALAGAGALRSTAADLVTFVRAQLDPGTSQLADAIELTHQQKHQINRWAAVHLGWMGLRLHPRFESVDLIWHNGGTGGFRSWIGFIPAKQAGVVVLSNTARSVDGRAFDLLQAIAFGRQLRGKS